MQLADIFALQDEITKSIVAQLKVRLLPREKKFIRSEGLAASARQMLAHFRNPQLVATYAVGFGVLFNFIATFTYVSFHLADAPYRWEVASAPLQALANVERRLPADYISADGYGISEACRRYLAPLIVGEVNVLFVSVCVALIVPVRPSSNLTWVLMYCESRSEYSASTRGRYFSAMKPRRTLRVRVSSSSSASSSLCRMRKRRTCDPASCASAARSALTCATQSLIRA